MAVAFLVLCTSKSSMTDRAGSLTFFRPVQLILLAVHYVIIFLGIPETRQGEQAKQAKQAKLPREDRGLTHVWRRHHHEQ